MSAIRLATLSTAQLAQAADENFVVHAGWAQQRTTGMRVVDDGHLLLTDSGLPADTFNIICRARFTPETALTHVEAALAYFRHAGRPFSWWVGPADQPTTLGELLLATGLEQAETELAMAVDLAVLPSADLAPAGLEIRRVRTTVELANFAHTIATTSDPPDAQVPHYYSLTAAALLAPDASQWFYVGYLEGQPVATAELTIGGGVVGLYNISTLEGYRRRGIGAALTLRPLLDARAAGYQVGVLQAAAQGVGIYQRIGFQAFGGITEYKPPTAQVNGKQGGRPAKAPR